MKAFEIQNVSTTNLQTEGPTWSATVLVFGGFDQSYETDLKPQLSMQIVQRLTGAWNLIILVANFQNQQSMTNSRSDALPDQIKFILHARIAIKNIVVCNLVI